jgi:multimeric flavodoxin WrbA/protein-tyrosine-phosphatase
MFVLGLQGSPRLKGNTNFLLSVFMEAAEQLGAETHSIHVVKKNILPCKEYTVCEKKGVCPIDDDMQHEIYHLIRKADLLVIATPIFFYNTTAQMKALIDRCQTFWARKYKLKLTDPGRKTRRGFLMAVGATRGKNLFEGLKLTTAYFFDAVGANFEGSLTYRGIEKPGDMKQHPSAVEDVKTAVDRLLKPFLGRKRILFVCRDNACLSQMAAAYAHSQAGDSFEVVGCGTDPADATDPIMEKAMQEQGVDMAFRKPQSVETHAGGKPCDWMITMGDNAIAIPQKACTSTQHWALPDPSGMQIESMRKLRNDIKNRVTELIDRLKHPQMIGDSR